MHFFSLSFSISFHDLWLGLLRNSSSLWSFFFGRHALYGPFFFLADQQKKDHKELRFRSYDWSSPSFLCRRRQRDLGLWLGYFFYSPDPRFMSLIDSPWFVKFSKMSNFNFRESWFGFIFLFFWDSVQKNPLPLLFLKFSSMEKVFKIYINLQTFFSSIFICILGGIRLSCPPLNCHYHQIGFALKQVVPVSYYDDPYTLLSFILNEFCSRCVMVAAFTLPTPLFRRVS